MDRLADLLDELRVETESVVSRPVGPLSSAGSGAPRRWSWGFVGRVARIAAAVAVLVSGGILYYSTYRAAVNNDTVPRSVEPLDPRVGISLRAETAERFMAVAKPTSEPDVQLYWLYPKMKSKRSENRS
jgi:hypothetical protein